MDTRIYCITHKKFTKPKDDLYVSLQVGRALNDDLGYQSDDTGDNISAKNKSYCELTGIYWLWKNVKCDIIGICHYRRYFVRNEDFITKEYIEKILESYDIIAPHSECTPNNSLLEHYKNAHCSDKDLNICRDVIAEKCPEYLEAFDLCFNCNLFSIGNMIITRKEIFDDYCEWLFDILFEAEKRIDITGYDDYQARVIGFLAERLLRVWLLKQSYRICEEEVRMINPEDADNAVKTVKLKYDYVKLVLKDLITLYSMGNYMDIYDISPLKVDFKGKTPVWVCWWQGEDEAPELVKTCIASIRKNIPHDKAQVHLITLDNVGEYITLPIWIIEKFEAGKITLTHLSDILRMGLLYRYGGMWIDATYFVSGKIPDEIFENNDFYTIKHENAAWKADITQGRWAGNIMKGEKENVLFRFALNAMYIYWYNQDTLVDYFLIDDIIALAYENIAGVREMIDACPYSQPNAFKFQSADTGWRMLNKKYNCDKYKKLIEGTWCFKFNRHFNLKKVNIVGEKTLFGHMCEQI